MIVNITYTPNDCHALITSVEQKMCINISEIGSPGLSAYQLAVANGFVGTEAEWLDSLKAKNYIRRHEYTNDISYCGIAIEGSLETDEVWKVTLIYVDANGDTFSCVFLNVAWSDRLDLEPCWGLDPDAVSFLDATGITDQNIKNAINALATDLKGYGLWDKMKAIYPFVGGTPTTHKFNLKDPRNLDIAFRLTFFGGWTHSSNGVLPNGTNAYADTFLTPSTSLSIDNASLGYYGGNNTGSSIDKATMGSLNGPPFKVFCVIPAYTGIGLFGDVNDGSITSTANTNTSGFIFITRTSSTQKIHSIRGTQTTKTETSTGLPTRKVVIGARNYNTIEFYSAIQHRFTFIGDGLTDTEASNLYLAVQNFQTALNRAII